jgi:5-methyltetrahydrofolate--homocysteine methyltransferase
LIFVEAQKSGYHQIREQRAGRDAIKKFLPLPEARKNKFAPDWANYTPPQPAFVGVKAFKDYPIEELTEYIDWTPFFQSWELAGKFPAILQDDIVGEEARKLYNDARSMLRRIIDEGWLQAQAVIGIFPANRLDDDDVSVFKDESREVPLTTLHFLRQQRAKAPGQPNLCLADFIAPLCPVADDSPHICRDYIGAFAVTAGIGIEKWVAHFEQQHDDYQAILLKALADRLAEALAEHLHERVRKEFWAYAASESLSNDSLIAEDYVGIRPAPGYPACPDHTEKATLWQLLQADQHTGISLTESFAMYPAASVSGWYFSHPDAKYFGLGEISKDQVEDYALRKGLPVETAEKWLAPVLNY